MRNRGRVFQMFLELVVTSGTALGLALVAPMSVWQSVGEAGVLAFAALFATAATAFVTLRPRAQRDEVSGVPNGLPQAG